MKKTVLATIVLCLVFWTVNTEAAVYPVGDPLVRPTYNRADNGYEITQSFNNKDGHTGVDLANGSSGGDIRAIMTGKVVRVNKDCVSTGGWGNMIRIKHTLSDSSVVYSQYAHGLCDSITVAVDDNISEGQVIMAVGSTGYSTGNHLHFEVKTVNSDGPGYTNNPPSKGFLNPLQFVADRLSGSAPNGDPSAPSVTIFWPLLGDRVTERPWRVEFRAGIEDLQSGVSQCWSHLQDVTNGKARVLHFDEVWHGEKSILLDSQEHDGYAIDLTDFADDIDIRLVVGARNTEGLETEREVFFHKNTEPPLPPPGFTLVSGINTLTASWPGCTAPEIVGYILSYGYAQNDWPYEICLPKDVTSYDLGGILTHHDFVQVTIRTYDVDGHISEHAGGLWGGKQAAATWHPDYVMVRRPSGAVYTKIDGQWRMFRNAAVLASYGGAREVIANISEAEFSRYPTGAPMPLAQAALVKLIDTGHYYAVDGGYLRELHNDAVVELGYNLSQAYIISLAGTGLIIGDSIFPGASHPVGTWLQVPGDASVYVVTAPFVRQGVSSMAILRSHWPDGAPVLRISSGIMNRYVYNGDHIRAKNGALIKDPATNSLGIKEHDVIRWFTNYPAYIDFGFHLMPVRELNAAELARENTGDPISSADIWEDRTAIRHVDGTFVKNRGSYAFVVNGELSLIYRSYILASWGFAFADAVEISDFEWASYTIGDPCPIRAGKLIKQGNELAIMGYGGVYYPFGSWPAFQGNGHAANPAWVLELSTAEVNFLTSRGLLIRSDHIIYNVPEHMPGELLKVGNSIVLLAPSAQYREFSSMDMLYSYRFDLSQIKVVSAGYLLANFANGGLMTFAGGALLSSTSTATVYVIDHGVKHALSNAAFLGFNYRWSLVRNINHTVLMGIPEGQPITDVYNW